MAIDPAGQDVDHLLAALDDALAIVRDSVEPAPPAALPVRGPASLLDQCLALCSQADGPGSEPVRSLHHFACTGGTLIAKCLAAQPNVQLLNEVDPLSRMLWQPSSPRFAPTDLITLMRQSTRGASEELLVRVFLDGIDVILGDCRGRGQRLLLRDHSHSHYCDGPVDRPGLREVLARRFPLLAAVTIRHPLHSYLAIREKGWISFHPATLDEYCRRYHQFLDDHRDLPMFRYEEFVQEPREQMRSLCAHLRLSYVDDFADRFDVFRLSGDSGRSGGVIAPRTPRQVYDAEIALECRRSRHYAELLERLGYGPGAEAFDRGDRDG